MTFVMVIGKDKTRAQALLKEAQESLKGAKFILKQSQFKLDSDYELFHVTSIGETLQKAYKSKLETFLRGWDSGLAQNEIKNN